MIKGQTGTNLFSRGDDDGGAFEAKTLGDCEADALSGSSDDNYFADESLSDLGLLHFWVCFGLSGIKWAVVFR